MRDADPVALDDAEAAALLAPFAGQARLALAVSGGPDSTALMLLAARWRRKAGKGCRITVLSVDHGLRAGSGDEARAVGQWARALGLDHEMLVWDGPKPGANIQAHARTARYRAMAAACLRLGVDTLVTAHHLEDQAETLLLRLARGSGVDGLSAMADRTALFGITIARPLLDVPRARLKAVLDAAGHPYVSDPGNQDARFARVRMRALMSQLSAEGLDARRLADTARRMRAARQVLELAADRLAAQCARIEPGGYCLMMPDALLAAPPETALRLLARTLSVIAGQAHGPRLERLEGLYEALGQDVMATRTLGGCRIARRNGQITLWREEGRAGLPELALEPGQSALWDGRFAVRVNQGQAGCVRVRALGAEGWRAVTARHTAPVGAAIGRTFVSFWQENTLLYAPHASGHGAITGELEARFVGNLQRAGSAPGAFSDQVGSPDR